MLISGPMNRQILWGAFQIAIVMGVATLINTNVDHPNLQGAVIIGICAAALVTGITMRLWPGSRTTKQVDDVDGGAFRLLRSNRHTRDSAKLVSRAGTGEDRR